jgi:hypothetical protein
VNGPRTARKTDERLIGTLAAPGATDSYLAGLSTVGRMLEAMFPAG